MSAPNLTIKKDRWSQVDLPERLYYLESCSTNLRRLAPLWVEIEAELRGHSPTSDEGAESWLLGPLPVARMIRYLVNGLKSGGRPKVPSRRLRIDGRSVSRVFPNGFHEGLLFWGTEGQVWSTGSQLQGARYRKARDGRPGTALVLGASNVSSIAATDLLSKLFCENRPVVCKIPPRFQPLEPVFKELFHPLVRDGHVQLVSGGAELGQQLLQDELFETVHLTGAESTYQKLLETNTFPDRSFTAELGCVTPAIIVPGPWSQKELQYQARHLASILVMNGGYNCVTPQILVLSKSWPFKTSFLNALRKELEFYSGRDDIFLGAEEKRQSFRQDYPEAELFGPRSLVQLDPESNSRLFKEEAFCGMLAWVELEESEPAEFLTRACDFCNTQLWGDLSCLLMVDSYSRRKFEKAVAHSITALQYGTVGVNVYTGLAFVSGVTPWGSYLDGKANTGNGWVHNTFFFDRPEKTVLEGSFIPPAPQPWVKPFKNLAQVGPALFELDLAPSGKALGRFLKAFGQAVVQTQKSLRSKR